MSGVQPGDPLNISAREWNDLQKLVPKSIGGSNTARLSHWVPEIYFAKTPSGGIPARVGTELGFATCEIYERDADDELFGTGRDETVWNIGDEISGDTYIIIATESRRRDFIAIAIDSSSSGFITDLRLDGSNLQYEKNGTWTTWETLTDCPEEGS